MSGYKTNIKQIQVTKDENENGVSIDINNVNRIGTLNVLFKCEVPPTIKIHVRERTNDDWILIYEEEHEKTSDLLILENILINYIRVEIPNANIDTFLLVKTE